MTLDDFFTSTELKDGLTSPSRVNELISTLLKEKDSIADATRQWSTVANTIAATENKDCLEFFVQLDGLSFIDRWLNNAQKPGNDSFEESTAALLRAVERLPIDNRMLFSSGIAKTVENLAGSSSSVVRDKAKALCDGWLQVKDSEPPQDGPTDNEGKNADETIPVVSKEETVIVEKTIEPEPAKPDPVDPPGDSKLAGAPEPETSGSTPKVESPTRVDTKDEDSNTESDSGADDGKKAIGDQSEDGSHSSEPSMNPEGGGADCAVVKGSDMELEYGMVDPLEVARRVAMEIEREVDSRERSCSTTSDGQTERPKSPDSTNGKPTQPIGPGPGPGGPGPEPETLGLDQKPPERDLGFDLNEAFSNEIDPPVVTSVSPVAPLRFEGASGWKGSAATSAFRRIPDGSGPHDDPKSLRFDLNVADEIEDDSSRDKNPIVSGFPSGEESSIEVSPRRSVKLQLDLNSLGDGSVDTVALEWRLNGRQSPSQSSSSSSMKNIDLNLEQPVNDHRQTAPHRDESVISLFGMQLPIPQPNRMELGRARWGLGPFSHHHHQGYPPAPPPMYYGPPGAPTPYVVDSRGSPMVPMVPIVPMAPQFMGSSPAVPPPPPFFMAAPGGSFGSGGLRQLFNDNEAGGSSAGSKRQEPEGGWEAFPVNYKHQQPPWK